MSLYESKGRPSPAGYRDVAPAEVPVPATDFTIVDVREPHEFTGELGHIPGATLVPMAGLLANAISWKKDAEFLVVCKAGGRSSSSAQALVKAGFTRVMNLTGGMLAWNAAGLKTER
jgi:rhodanese-related sulfurtransferase